MCGVERKRVNRAACVAADCNIINIDCRSDCYGKVAANLLGCCAVKLNFIGIAVAGNIGRFNRSAV